MDFVTRVCTSFVQQQHEVPGDVVLPEGPPAALPSIPAANSSESETGGEALKGVSGDWVYPC